MATYIPSSAEVPVVSIDRSLPEIVHAQTDLKHKIDDLRGLIVSASVPGTISKEIQVLRQQLQEVQTVVRQKIVVPSEATIDWTNLQGNWCVQSGESSGYAIRLRDGRAFPIEDKDIDRLARLVARYEETGGNPASTMFQFPDTNQGEVSLKVCELCINSDLVDQKADTADSQAERCASFIGFPWKWGLGLAMLLSATSVAAACTSITKSTAIQSMPTLTFSSNLSAPIVGQSGLPFMEKICPEDLWSGPRNETMGWALAQAHKAIEKAKTYQQVALSSGLCNHVDAQVEANTVSAQQFIVASRMVSEALRQCPFDGKMCQELTRDLSKEAAKGIQEILESIAPPAGFASGQLSEHLVPTPVTDEQIQEAVQEAVRVHSRPFPYAVIAKVYRRLLSLVAQQTKERCGIGPEEGMRLPGDGPIVVSDIGDVIGTSNLEISASIFAPAFATTKEKMLKYLKDAKHAKEHGLTVENYWENVAKECGLQAVPENWKQLQQQWKDVSIRMFPNVAKVLPVLASLKGQMMILSNTTPQRAMWFDLMHFYTYFPYTLLSPWVGAKPKKKTYQELVRVIKEDPILLEQARRYGVAFFDDKEDKNLPPFQEEVEKEGWIAKPYAVKRGKMEPALKDLLGWVVDASACPQHLRDRANVTGPLVDGRHRYVTKEGSVETMRELLLHPILTKE